MTSKPRKAEQRPTPDKADLDSCRAKLARSKQKLDALNAAVVEFFADEPYRVVIEQNDEGRYVVLVRAERVIPVEWGDDAGEIALAARSALDHLVYQLAIDSGGKVPKGARTQFPIFLDHDHYIHGGARSWRERMLAGVAPRHRRIIDNLQPYQRRSRQPPRPPGTTTFTSSSVRQRANTGGGDPLALLRALSDRDKHRDRVRPSVYVPECQLAFTGDGPDSIQSIGLADGPETEREDGAICMTAPIARYADGTERQVKLKIEGRPEFALAFQGDAPVALEDLDRIVLHVAGIIDRFESRIRR